VKTSVVLTSVILGAFASCAVAADFSIKGSVSETVDASKNYFLSAAPTGATAKSLTSGTLDFLAQTPTTRYLLDTNYSYYKYFGPGAADVPLVWGTPFNIAFSIDHVTELAKYNFNATWNRADEATTILAQTGVAAGRGSVNTYSVGGGVNRDLSRADTVSWTANASAVSYTDPAQTPSNDLTAGLTWNHDLSSTIGLINSVNLDWFAADNDTQSERLFWKLTTGLQSRLSSRLIFSADVGVGFANAWQKGATQTVVAPPVILGPGQIPPLVPFQSQAGTGNSILADVALTYDLLKTTKVSITAAQAIAPVITGQLQKSDTVGLTVSHAVNSYSNLSFATQLTYVPASPAGNLFGSQSSASDFFSAALSYGYQFTREWRSNVSYTYLVRNDDTGVVRSSIILVSLTRDFNVLGNPTAINQAEAERARQRERNSVGYVFPFYH